MKAKNATPGTRVQNKWSGRAGTIREEESDRPGYAVVHYDRHDPDAVRYVALNSLRLTGERPVGVRLLPLPAGALLTNLGPCPVRLLSGNDEAVLTIPPGMTVQLSPAWVAAPPEPAVATGSGLYLPAERDRLIDALRLIGWHGCSHFTGDWSCRRLGSGKIRGSHYGHNDWCEACIALDALNAPSMARPAKDGTYPEPPDRANYQPTPED